MGYLFLGTAYLCKQSFALVAPAAVLLLGDARRPRAWVAAALPALLYAVYLGATGALPDAVAQLGSQTELHGYGILRFVYHEGLHLPVLLGALAMALTFGVLRTGFWARTLPLQWCIGAFLAVFPIVLALWALPSLGFFEAPSFSLLGALLGAVLFSLVPRVGDSTFFGVGALGVLVVWSSAISIGYNTPALAAGIAAEFLLGLVSAGMRRLPKPGWTRYLLSGAAAVLALLAMFQLDVTRRNMIYREARAISLTSPLDGVFAGGSNLKTNPNTAEFLADLKEAVRQTGGEPYAILPDLAAYWVRSEQPNPLPIDWALYIELNQPSLVARVTDELERGRGRRFVLVQKVQAERSADGFFPFVNRTYSPAANYVTEHFQHVGSTRYFDLYR
jgi:hypothetical protein